MRSGDVVGRVGYRPVLRSIVEQLQPLQAHHVSPLQIVFLRRIRETTHIAHPAGAMTVTASVGISVFPG